MYVKPTLEELEGREVPSGNTLIWNAPTDGNWSVANNWKDAVTGKPPAAAPSNGDILQFDETVQTNSTDDLPNLTYIAALIVNANYTKEIDISYLSFIVGTADGTNPSGVTSGLGGGALLLGTQTTFELFGGATFSATGGKIAFGTFQVDAGANLNFTGTGSQLIVTTLKNNGSVDLNTTGDLHENDATITNTGASAGFTIEGSQSLVEDGTGSWFNNDSAAVLLKLGAGTTSTIPGTFWNGGGTVDLNQGTTLKLTGTASQGGGITHLVAGSNLWTTNGYTVNGGRLTTGGPGSSTITGNLSVSDGIVSPGQDGSLGTLDITGNCTLGANSELNIDVSVSNGIITSSDLLVLNTTPGGTLTLQGGTLNVNLIGDGISPADGQTVNIIQFLSVAGDFGPFNTVYPGGFWTGQKKNSTYELIANTF